MKSIFLKRGKDESLRRFHPWIFSGAIQTYVFCMLTVTFVANKRGDAEM
jgi:hypothetical protein